MRLYLEYNVTILDIPKYMRRVAVTGTERCDCTRGPKNSMKVRISGKTNAGRRPSHLNPI